VRSDAEIAERFTEVVAGLANGSLLFPPPFDFATSLALAANIDLGALAQQLFDVTAARDTKYEVSIYACSGDHENVRRQIIDTTVASTQVLYALLEHVLDELDERAQEKQ
jgi:hypothetical protein